METLEEIEKSKKILEKINLKIYYIIWKRKVWISINNQFINIFFFNLMKYLMILKNNKIINNLY